VNPELSTDQQIACLQILERGLVQIRFAAMSGDAKRAEAIADALHNLPRLVWEGEKWGWTIEGFRRLFLDELVRRFRDLAGLEQPLD
jgi:hypothetical protein